MAGSNNDLQKDIDSIKADLGTLREDLQVLKDDAMEVGRSVAREKSQQAQLKAQEGWESAQSLVREKPLIALGAAFAVGLVAQKLIGK